jgi:energy-coupling factor transporter ATP-binding protein EcfA2
MAIILKRTSAVEPAFVKVLVYGASGSGKTTLIPSLPKPIALSAEAGLLSIRGADIPYIEINSMEALRDVYAWLTSSAEAAQFESVAIDSLSEIAEVVLSAEKKSNKDPRAAYGEMQDQVSGLIRAFRDLPEKHVYMSAKVERSQDEGGRLLYAPSMPGNKLGQSLPYFFDMVFALRAEKDEAGIISRSIQTGTDGIWSAKDRSGILSMWEPADLGAIIKKVCG